MTTFWKYSRWIFPPFYLYLVLLYLYRGVKWVCRKIWAGFTWPYRKLCGLFSRKKGRQFKNDKEGYIWATTFLSDSLRRRPMTMDYFRKIWETCQRHDSYIIHETIEAVALYNGLTTEQLVFIMCHPSYECRWNISGWIKILEYYGAVDRKNHTHCEMTGYSLRAAQRDWGDNLWGLSD